MQEEYYWIYPAMYRVQYILLGSVAQWLECQTLNQKNQGLTPLAAVLKLG